MTDLVGLLINIGKKELDAPYEIIEFTDNEKANHLLNNIEVYPHAFVLASLMDIQMLSEQAGLIPYKVSQKIGGFGFKELNKLKLENIQEIFDDEKLHRFYNKMANRFYLAIEKIHVNYDNDASNIWKNNPQCSTVIGRFLEFDGIGPKIATMATNTLYRGFKIKMQNPSYLDISVDVHVTRVMERTELIRKGASIDEMIYKARSLYPEYPGIIDLGMWRIGRNMCLPTNPKCDECILDQHCPKVFN